MNLIPTVNSKKSAVYITMSSPSTSDSLQELYNSVKWQNDLIQTQQSTYAKQYSSDQQKVKYLLGDIGYYTYINFILWIIYYILSLAVIYFTFYGKQRGYSVTTKIMIILAFLLYPMLIMTVELWLYRLFSYLYSFLVGTAYQKDTVYETPKFDLLNAMPPGMY